MSFGAWKALEDYIRLVPVSVPVWQAILTAYLLSEHPEPIAVLLFYPFLNVAMF
jgi:hypothetical protein